MVSSGGDSLFFNTLKRIKKVALPSLLPLKLSAQMSRRGSDLACNVL